MAYHEAYWLAVGAAAPVIALASTVSITDVVSVWFGAEIDPPRSFRFYYFAVIWVAAGNLFLQAVALFQAVKSLLQEKDFAGANLGVFVVVFGLKDVLIMVAYNVRLRYLLCSAQTKRKKAESQ